MPLRAVVVDDPAALLPHRAAWDALAEAASQPFCGPDLLLAWWTHARPPKATLATVLVHDDAAGGALVGVAPFFCDRGAGGARRWRPLAAQTCQRVEPVAVPGREAEVARAIACALRDSAAVPALLSFEGVAERSPWPRLLADAWPSFGRCRLVRTGEATALTLTLKGTDFDAWLASKSSHFRQRLRKKRKVAFARDGAYRLADASTVDRDIESFIRLHIGRWEDRGGSAAVPAGVAAALREAAPALVASGRLRLWSLDLGAETIASSLVFRAGDEVGYWLNGFDAAHHDLEPSKISILHVVEDAWAAGGARLDLGEGDFAYKRRFADGEETLVRVAVVPPSVRRLPVAAVLAVPVLRRTVAEHLSDEHRQRLRQAVTNPPWKRARR